MPEHVLNLTLTGEDADRLTRIMRSGGFETYEAAVGEALFSLESSAGPAIDHWLDTVVAERLDIHRADPTRAVPIEEARRRILGQS